MKTNYIFQSVFPPMINTNRFKYLGKTFLSFLIVMYKKMNDSSYSKFLKFHYNQAIKSLYTLKCKLRYFRMKH